MVWVRAFGSDSVYITRYRSMKVPVSFRTSHAMTDKKILVDSGATNNFIHPRLVKRLGLGTNQLEKPKKVWNVDGTTNRGGELTHYVDLEVKTGSEKQKMRFLVTDLGDDDLIPGCQPSSQNSVGTRVLSTLDSSPSLYAPSTGNKDNSLRWLES